MHKKKENRTDDRYERSTAVKCIRRRFNYERQYGKEGIKQTVHIMGLTFFHHTSMVTGIHSYRNIIGKTGDGRWMERCTRVARKVCEEDKRKEGRSSQLYNLCIQK
jgi:hypothetical protein